MLALQPRNLIEPRTFRAVRTAHPTQPQSASAFVVRRRERNELPRQSLWGISRASKETSEAIMDRQTFEGDRSLWERACPRMRRQMDVKGVSFTALEDSRAGRLLPHAPVLQSGRRNHDRRPPGPGFFVREQARSYDRPGDQLEQGQPTYRRSGLGREPSRAVNGTPCA